VDETQHGSPLSDTTKTEGSQRVYAQERPKENFPSTATRTPKRGKSTPTPSNRHPLGAALPASETGQRLTNLFPNGWDWIYSDPPSRDNKPNWETVNNYPLTPIEQWIHHQNPDILIGIRPAATTRWGILDIDRHSKYHPTQNPEALQTIQNTLEDIGITRTLINQSSHSGGLHLYIPLPELVSSYWLSITLKYHLEAAGIQIRSGQCELFPNPKRYIPKGQGFSHFNGIRMPMQPNTGFIPLDQDLNPLPWSLEDWLNAFDIAASHQDLTKLTHQIEEAKHNHKIRTHRNPHSIDTWRERIEQEKIQGWTGPGQTNEKLKIFGCEARVFLNMDSEQQIADYIQQTAQNTPGFYDHSNHTRDIAQRSREIAQWVIRYYWPLGATPSRETGYHTPPMPIASFSYHQAKREAAQERIKAAIAQIQSQNHLPALASERAKLITQIARVSQQTLYKAFNKPLWHPDHIPAQTPEPPIQQDITPLNPKQPEISKPELLQPLLTGCFTQLFKYVGFVILNLLSEAVAALPPQGQRAARTAIAPLEPQKLREGGSPRGESTPVQLPITNFAELKATLPDSFQAKIVKAERQRKQDQDREQQRRERALARQQLLIPTSLPSQSTATAPQRPSFLPIPSKITPLLHETASQRPPTLAEQSEFETWYALAEQFRLVTDHHWENSEYWVESNEQWHPYCELSGTFTTKKLKQYLHQ
jgi:hypothetical protein